ncbi:MAG: TonB-dependent receptor plug domain-containing protein [Gemmatimonadales bacterium]
MTRRVSARPSVPVCAVLAAAGCAAAPRTAPQPELRQALTPEPASCRSIESQRLGPVASLSAGLQGQLAGLQVLPSTARSGAASSIRLRGNGSVARSSEPLVYVDDVRVGSIRISSVRRFINAQALLNALDFLDPVDVETIEVLSGPAATMMYGTDAANGVIRVYTKTGRGSEQPGGRRARCPD